MLLNVFFFPITITLVVRWDCALSKLKLEKEKKKNQTTIIKMSVRKLLPEMIHCMEISTLERNVF